MNSGKIPFGQILNDLQLFLFRHDSFTAGYTNLREAFKRINIQEKPWYDWVQTLNHFALKAIQDLECYDEFETCYDWLRRKQGLLKKREDRVAIRFAMIDQLVMLILQASSEDTLVKTCDMLLDLAEKSELEGWVDDVEVFEALLEAFSIIYGSVKNSERVETALEVMQNFQKPALVKAFTDWLGGLTLPEKLMCTSGEEDLSEPDRIFQMAEKEISATANLGDALEYSEELRALYEATDFAEVSPCCPAVYKRPLHPGEMCVRY